MSALFKKILMVLIGFVAGIASWTIIEILLKYGEFIGSHIIWNALAGAAAGLLFGFFFGSAEGIMLSDSSRSIRGGIIGAVIGFAGGAAAMIISQWILYAIGNTEYFTSKTTSSFIIPISRAAGWGILGLAIGSLDGIRGRSARRSAIGISGGLVGGLIGGLMLEFLTRAMPNGFIARGAGLALMGGSIGLFFSIFEYSRSYGILKILTGPYRGKEYILVMKNTYVGSSSRAHIPLKDYSGIKKNHMVIKANRNSVRIKKVDGDIMVNERPITEKELKYEDVIQAGSAKILYLPK